jgi:hypothetical protein
MSMYFVSYSVNDLDSKILSIKNTGVPLNGKVTGIPVIRDIEQYVQKMEKFQNVTIISWGPFETIPEVTAPETPTA